MCTSQYQTGQAPGVGGLSLDQQVACVMQHKYVFLKCTCSTCWDVSSFFGELQSNLGSPVTHPGEMCRSYRWHAFKKGISLLNRRNVNCSILNVTDDGCINVILLVLECLYTWEYERNKELCIAHVYRKCSDQLFLVLCPFFYSTLWSHFFFAYIR